MTFSWIVGALITCTSLAQPTAGEAPTPESVAALQLKTSAIFDTLSYTAVVKSGTLEDFSPELFRRTTVYKYARRGSSLLLTQESSKTIRAEEQRKNGKVIDPVIRISDVPSSRRVLIADEFTLLWPEAATPLLMLNYAADWKDSPRDYREGLLSEARTADLKIHGFGPATPFYTLQTLSPEFTTWDVAVQPDGALEIKRTITIGPDKKSQDLTILVDAETGLMKKSYYNAGRGETTCSVEFTQIPYKGGTLTVPKSYVSRSTDGTGAVQEELEISFSDFKDESDLPPYRLEDFGIPEDAEIECAKSRSEFLYFKWKGGALNPIAQPNLKLREHR